MTGNPNTAPAAPVQVGNPNLLPRGNYRAGRPVISLNANPVPESTPAKKVEPKVETVKTDTSAEIDTKSSKLPESKRKYTIDGKEVELTDAEATAEIQKSRSASQKFEQAAKDRKAVEDGLALLKTDPLEGFRQLGVDPGIFVKKLQEAAAADAKRQAELAKMTPEQREHAALREENARLKADKEANETKEKTRAQQIKQETTNRTVIDMINRTCDELKVPKTKDGMLFITQILKDAIGKMDENDALSKAASGKIPVKRLMEKARARASSYLKWASNGYNSQQLLSILPPEVIKAIKESK